MSFQITSKDLADGKLVFVCADNELSGVKKVAGYVAEDFEKVFGSKPVIKENEKGAKSIVFATLGVSALLDSFVIDVSEIENKRECYLFSQSADGNTLYIIGSDKRGTVYGLFHLSELVGVSSMVDWLGVDPVHKDEVILEGKDMVASKEPSVRYRGFFINDEWPAFGNWTLHHFGGINAKCYEHIFKVLLRMKGNYLWPAMWSGRFSVDGPGLESAILADELGVVMGMSHHEPCLRHGEEYKYLRGKDSIYGDAWNFITNREGITKFWEDGLIRSGKFENVITVGMRGEADSTILGRNATLKDNIDLLRDVLATQKELIKKYVNENLDEVPRMLALYKEVEPFFYGDENTEGLIGSEDLDGVTLMLCDDNHGNLRTLPDKSMRDHKGGYGMYYHFDYHGLPISYEWVNSSSLHKTWEQMTNAYEFGIRDLWIVNVGDVFTNEFPLAYFLDMAYDYDKWGVKNKNSASEYSKLFVSQNFANYSVEDKAEILDLLEEYTRISHIRRPEHMNDKVYAPMAYRERETLYAQIEDLMARTEKINKEKYSLPFYEIVYYPLMGNLNNQKLWLDTTYNHYLSEIGASMTNEVGDKVYEGLDFDKKLVDDIHAVDNGRWYGMGLSEHVGFNRWNEEECKYPVVHSLKPSNKARIIVAIPETGMCTEGWFWTKKRLVLPDFARYNSDKASIYLYSTSALDAECEISVSSDVIKVCCSKAVVPAKGMLAVEVEIDKDKAKNATENPEIKFTTDMMNATVEVLLPATCDLTDLPNNTYVFADDYVSIEADGYSSMTAGKNDDGVDAAFALINDFGKTKCGVKAFPVTSSFNVESNRPSVTYSYVTKSEGSYDVLLLIAPTNPVYRDNKLELIYNVNGTDDKLIDVYTSDYKIADGNPLWSQGALDNIREVRFTVECKEGLNNLSIKPVSPGLVIEKLCISKSGSEVQYGYLGPRETYKLK